jgi:Uncharacterized alpha/beta hydrolase domain (DUF2235)
VALTPYVHNPKEFRIACLGVFDTVGALGVPLQHFRLYNRDLYEFHNVELSSTVEVNLHALAIDEHRVPFRAAIGGSQNLKSTRVLRSRSGFLVLMQISVAGISRTKIVRAEPTALWMTFPCSG